MAAKMAEKENKTISLYIKRDEEIKMIKFEHYTADLRPIWAKLGPKMGKLGPEMGKLGPKMAKLGFEMAKLVPKMAMLGPKMAGSRRFKQ